MFRSYILHPPPAPSLPNLVIYLPIYLRETFFFFSSELRLQGSKMLCICKAHNL